MKAEMVSIFRETFSHVETVEAHSDLLGAARALCDRNEGIACILGTGANSCLYDGEHIVKNTPALGYILGDEGSGAVLGKRFLHDLYSGLLSEEIKSEFEAFMKMTLADVIRRVYREPLANRFLASLSTFIHDHLDDNDVYELVVGCFRDFFEIHLVAYHRSDLPVSFVGSIAWYYQEILHDVAEREGFRTGTFLRAPLEGLVRYHCL